MKPNKTTPLQATTAAAAAAAPQQEVVASAAAPQSVKLCTAEEFRREIVRKLLLDVKPISNKVKHGTIQVNVALRPEDYIQMQIRPEDYDTWREKTLNELGLSPHFHRICNPSCTASDDERRYDERIPHNVSIQFFIPISLQGDIQDEQISRLVHQANRVAYNPNQIEEASIAVLYDLTGRAAIGLNKEIPPTEVCPLPTTLAEDCLILEEQISKEKGTILVGKHAYLSDHEFAEPDRVFFDEAAGNTSGSRRPPQSAPPVTDLLHGIEETTCCGPKSRNTKKERLFKVDSRSGKIKCYPYPNEDKFSKAIDRQEQNEKKRAAKLAEEKAKRAAEEAKREAKKKAERAKKKAERAKKKAERAKKKAELAAKAKPPAKAKPAAKAKPPAKKRPRDIKANCLNFKNLHSNKEPASQAREASAAAASSNPNSTFFRPATRSSGDASPINASGRHNPRY